MSNILVKSIMLFCTLSLQIMFVNEIYCANSASNQSTGIQNSESNLLILTQPTSKTISYSNSNNKVFFNIETTEGCNYLWEQSSDNGSSWSSINSSNTNFLFINNINMSFDNYKYRCIVSKDGITETSNVATLKVKESGTNDLRVEVQTVESVCGVEAHNYLSVNVSGFIENSSGALQYKWTTTGNGYFEQENDLQTKYVVNVKDREKEIVIALEVYNSLDETTFIGYTKLNVLFNSNFSLELRDLVNGEKTQDINRGFGQVMGLNPGVIRNTFPNQKVDYESLKLEHGLGLNHESQMLIDIDLFNKYINSEVSYARVFVYVTLNEVLEDADLELYEVLDNWNSETTWNTKPNYGLPIEGKITNIWEVNDEEIKKIKMCFTFNVSNQMKSWYNGDSYNRGFMLKIADSINKDVEIEVFKSGNSNNYLISSADFSSKGQFVCLEKEYEIAEKNVNYIDWDVRSQFRTEGTKAILKSRYELNMPNSPFSYAVFDVVGNGCQTPYCLITVPTPDVIMPDVKTISTSLLTVLPKHTIATKRLMYYNIDENRNALVNWMHNGGGDELPLNQTQPTYNISKQDFGKEVTFTATIKPIEDCEDVIRTASIIVEYPLHPYAGAEKKVCIGDEVKITDASATYGLTDEAIIEEALSYILPEEEWTNEITAYSWTSNGQGNIVNAHTLSPTYIPKKYDDGTYEDGPITLTLTIRSKENFNSKTSTTTINYCSTKGANVGDYESVVGEQIVLNKIKYGNVFEPVITSDGNGELIITDTEYPTYTPTKEDLNKGTVEFLLSSGSCDQVELKGSLKVFPPIDVEVSEDILACAKEKVQLSVSGGDSYKWSPSVGLDNSTSPNPTVTVDQDITYTVIVYKKYENKTFTTSRKVNIKVKETPIAKIENFDANVCPNLVTTLNALEQENSEYLWKSDNEVIGNSKSLTLNVSEYSKIELVVTNANGCLSSIEEKFSIRTDGEIFVNSSDCQSTDAIVSAKGYTSVKWEPANNFECSTCFHTKIVKPDYKKEYRFIGYNNGCEFEKKFNVYNQLPPIIFGQTNYKACPNTPISFALNSEGSNLSYSWNESSMMDNTTILNPTVEVNKNTTFRLIATDDNGCNTALDVFVEVVDLPTIEIEDQVIICRGDNYVVKSNSTAEWVEWTPTTGVNNPNILYTTISPSESIIYNVKYGVGECEAESNIEVVVNQCSKGDFNYDISGEDDIIIKVTPVDIDESCTYEWTFGDGGEPLTGAILSKIFTKEGDYDICLKVTCKDGTYTHCQNVKIKKKVRINCSE